ncbi:MAG: sugar transferase [Bacteroidota bacterium]
MNTTLEETRLKNNLEFYKDINSYLKSFSKNERVILSGQIVTLEDWKKSRRLRRLPVVGFFVSMIEFVFFRFLPKVVFFKTIYKTLGFNSNKFLSKAEILGRFIYNGFEIISFSQEDGYHSFKIIKISTGLNNYVPTGFIIPIERLGKNGKKIKVYKIRTMHSYSEYIHKYMILNNGFNEKGKINNDFRITKWGKLLRKFWIDEIPQLYNLLKGDLKLVGIRPVGEAYFIELPQEMKEKRLLFKPGCIPPYVSLNMQSSIEEVIKADEIYLSEYAKNKYVDFRYFFLAIYCIIVKRKRSS